MKKFLALTMALAMVMSLAACGNSSSSSAGSSASNSSSASQSDASSSGDTSSSGELTTIQEGKLIMSTNAAFPPYEMTDDNGNVVGIDADIAAAIAEKLGLELVIDDMDFDSALLAVQQGKSDMVMAGVSVDPEREAVMDFSTSYATGIQSIVVKEDSPITSADNLYVDGADYQIGVQQDTTGDIYCSDDFGDDHVQRFNKGADAVAALVSGKLDCVVIDNEPAKSFVAANEGLKVLDTAYAVEDYAAAFAKGSELTEPFNKALEELITDGTVQKIVDKYISAD